MSDFEIVTTTAGAVSIRNIVVNEIMHNPVGPWREANDLYIKQSRFEERLLAPTEDDFVLFDVGLGAASNALAAIHARLNLDHAQGRRLHIVSFENNLELLRFALANANAFDHMRGFEEALTTLLETNHWESPTGLVTWDLRPGDFLELIDHETYYPELVFYDPYSPAVNQEMRRLAPGHHTLHVLHRHTGAVCHAARGLLRRSRNPHRPEKRNNRIRDRFDVPRKTHQ